MSAVYNKKQMFDLLLSGCFGNSVYHTTDPRFVLNDGYSGGVRHMRPGLPFLSNQTAVDAYKHMVNCPYGGGCVFGRATPDHLLTFQGEYAPDGRLWFSRAKLTMRRALREAPEWASGLLARSLLKHYMCPSSYADFLALTERYPDSVVEFSCYRVPWGTVPGRNTVVWEVRNY